MRVAVVCPYALDVVGGVQAHVLQLADALRRGGDEVIVVGPARAVTDGAARRTSSFHVVGRTVPVPANGSRAPVALGPAAALRVRRLLRRAAPDVVHVHEPLVPVVGPAAAVSAGAPLVLTFHATAEGGLLPRAYRAVRAPARPVVGRADALTAVSPVAAAFHARMLGLDVGELAVVPNGVEVARFAAAAPSARAQPRAPARAGAGRLIVFLGRLEPRKGVDVALEAFLRLAGTDPDVRLLVLGDGPLAPTLRERAARAPADVAGRIELAGRADPEELPALLAAADVAVLPARGGESFGIVLLEAMAAGVPIVATDIPGYRAVARHDREALLVPPGDPVALAGALGRVLGEPVLAERLRAACRARAEEHDWSAVAARTREVYERAVRLHGRRPAGS